MVNDDVNGIEVTRVGAVASQDAGGESTLQRRKTEDGVVVPVEDELDKPVAETADAVVEEDGWGMDNAFEDFSICGVCRIALSSLRGLRSVA